MIHKLDLPATSYFVLMGMKILAHILIAVKNTFAAEMLSVPMIPVSNIELLFVLVVFGNKKIILGGVYVPPVSGSDIYDSHIHSVEFLHSQYSDNEFIFMGDFNLLSANCDDSNLGVHFSPSSTQSDFI
ncbi:Endonuclease/exonuclease/phosphatase [Cinara cedri]|uniref:Endonuclease/exonuclease/phosphatase n=1 Tax=Cinara cedri TaxID=506608 RepID=A0A5E4MSY4_9HEMI|nr:Endonuclease/exonuclease/phosphatase [Cinara cedri]